MAYDGYRSTDAPYDRMGNLNQTEQHQHPRYAQYTTPYPSGDAQYVPDRVNMPQPQMPPTSPTASLSPSETLPDGARFAQPPPPPQLRPGSINDAVNSAFNNADTSAYLTPEVLSQITATVIQQLKASGLGQASAQTQPQPQPQVNPPSHPAQQPTWPQASGVMPPPPDPTPAMSSRATAPPSTAESNYVPPHAEYTASPTTARFATDTTQPSPGHSAAPSMERRASLSSQGSEHAQKGPRPRPPSRDATVTEMTTLEKIWGKLFENGKPTERLGQFLRGIAVHMIECYPTKNSLVVLPEKMQRFYKDTHVKSDPYAWHDIFDDRTSSISRLYREIEAEHHLVQENLSERPDIPGLTPRGFEKWATLMILAHPDREYERLQKAVLDMPISNPDDRKERFPKEIPRKLFPDIPDLVLRERLDRYLTQHCGVDLPPITEEERSKVASVASQAAHRNSERVSMSHATTGPEVTASAFADRGNNSQSASASSSAIVDDDEETIPARPIERERKPYSAQPGGGKIYDESTSSTRPPRESFSTRSRPKMDPPSASAAASAQRPSEHYNQESLYAPSGAGVVGGGRQGTASAHRRSRSSSLSVNARGDYRHSDTDVSGNDHVPRYTGLSSAGDQRYMNTAPTTTASAATDLTTEDGRRFRDFDRDRDRAVRDDERLYDTLRERERERDKKFHDHLQSRGTWPNEDEYYRGLLGGQGGGPVGSGSGGYDYRSYAYR